MSSFRVRDTGRGGLRLQGLAGVHNGIKQLSEENSRARANLFCGTYEAHMENITFARFSREDLEVTSDECIIKAGGRDATNHH